MLCNFGAEDNFFNLFSKMALISPFLPCIGPASLFQPVYVDDVALAIESVLEKESRTHLKEGIFELGGPEVISFQRLLQLTLNVIRRKRIILKIPFWAAHVLAPIILSVHKISFGILPLLISKDSVEQLKTHNIVSDESPGFKELGINPRSAEPILASYLYRYRPRGQFSDL